MVLAAMKVRGLSVYTHAQPGHPRPTSIEDMQARHRNVATGGNLRAAVFGVNDGLVSNCSLILGVAGAAASNNMIVLSGVAGLLAGAFSMAAGEWVSVRSQREMFEHQIGLERKELAEYPAEEAQELALIYEARGLPADEAAALATSTVADPVKALDTLAREELGLNPDELGSPWGAAISSFLSFALGALIPLAPFLFVRGEAALPTSIGITAVALFAVGAATSLFTGRSAMRDGVRMLAIGGGAGAVTYAIGKLLGVGLG
jgi:VIT1/CCC1 family predicted Fe2+/Mn2+ transporter